MLRELKKAMAGATISDDSVLSNPDNVRTISKELKKWVGLLPDGPVKRTNRFTSQTVTVPPLTAALYDAVESIQHHLRFTVGPLSPKQRRRVQELQQVHYMMRMAVATLDSKSYYLLVD